MATSLSKPKQIYYPSLISPPTNLDLLLSTHFHLVHLLQTFALPTLFYKLQHTPTRRSLPLAETV